MIPIQWEIQYNDDTKETGTDNLSKKAYNNPNVISFYLLHNQKYIKVNLLTGEIEIEGLRLASPFGKQKYRLIYYRTVSASISPKGTQIEEDIPSVGWQVTIDEKNHKRIFKFGKKIILE